MIFSCMEKTLNILSVLGMFMLPLGFALCLGGMVYPPLLIGAVICIGIALLSALVLSGWILIDAILN